MACPVSDEMLGNELKLYVEADEYGYVEVGGLIDLQGPTASRGEVDTKTLTSNVNRTRAGLKDYGEISFTLKLAFSQLDTLMGYYEDGLNRDWKLEVTPVDASVMTLIGCGWVKSVQPVESAANDEMIKAKVTVRLISAFELAEAA